MTVTRSPRAVVETEYTDFCHPLESPAASMAETGSRKMLDFGFCRRAVREIALPRTTPLVASIADFSCPFFLFRHLHVCVIVTTTIDRCSQFVHAECLE